MAAWLSPSAKLHPPKALPPRKARTAAECLQLEQLPNIGPSIAADLRLIGVQRPADLAGADALALYSRLCSVTGKRHDPCVLDTFMAATDFMGGAEPRPWWAYTAQRKATFGPV
jgi:hypothetical protein